MQLVYILIVTSGGASVRHKSPDSFHEGTYSRKVMLLIVPNGIRSTCFPKSHSRLLLPESYFDDGETGMIRLNQ